MENGILENTAAFNTIVIGRPSLSSEQVGAKPVNGFHHLATQNW